MHVLVTAGNTQTPIDRVRCLTNVFSGRTGARVAAEAAARGHGVTLLTSHPDALGPAAGVTVRPYRTFDELEALMAEELTARGHDAVLHAAAVGDYHVVGTFAKRGNELVDVAAGKVKSTYPELWLKLVPSPKLVDKVRTPWGFRGVLVKFKLEVGVSDEELLAVAERSRVQSAADLICANTLDGMHDRAYVGDGEVYRRVERLALAVVLVEQVEWLHTARTGAEA